MIKTKYDDVLFQKKDVISDIKRLINQTWKLIPMKENNENWKKQLNQVLIEITGLQTLFYDKISLLIVLSKLEGLKEREEIEFIDYRSTVFSIISILGEINEQSI